MKVKRTIRNICIFIGVLCVLSVLILALLTSPAVPIRGWKTLHLSSLRHIYNTATVLDANGDVLAENLYDGNKIFTPLSAVPSAVREAFVAVEDKRFYTHKGVDYRRMLGALKNNLLAGAYKEGASTITQQLIKNTHLSNEKSLKRKLQEIRLAKQLEKQYSKEQILEAYLNILYFGNNIYGIGRAAQLYFGKSVSELSVSDGALLAGIINNPALYNPVSHPENAKKRRDLVLKRMVQSKMISEEAAKQAADIPVDVSLSEQTADTYIENCLKEAARALHCGKSELLSRKPTIYTAADRGKIDMIYSTMSDIVLKNGIKYRCCVVDNARGEVRADVGNVPDCFSVRRQPGSVIKPIFGYAAALERRLVTPATVLTDERRDFGGYAPKNFRDTYYGAVTVTDSLKYSLNVPAVALADACGIPYCKSVASRLGIPFAAQDDGLALSLGGMHDGVTLTELADAYAALARGGRYVRGGLVRKIEIDGVCVYRADSRQTQALGEDTAFLLTNMLRACAKDGTAQKLSAFENVAAKTGTVERGQKNSDAYCIAYTPKYTVAAWVGIEEDADVKIYGGREPAAIVQGVLARLRDKSAFAVPDDVVLLDVDETRLRREHEVCLAAPSLPPRYRASYYFSRKNLPQKFSYAEVPYYLDRRFESGDLQNFEIVDCLA